MVFNEMKANKALPNCLIRDEIQDSQIAFSIDAADSQFYPQTKTSQKGLKKNF